MAYLQKRIERSKHKGKNPFNDSDGEGSEAGKKNVADVVEQPTGLRSMDGRFLTREEALAIIGADDDVAEV